MKIFKWEWDDLQKGHQVGMGENQTDFSYFLTVVLSVSAFIAVFFCSWWRDLGSLSWYPAAESIISLDSLHIYAENDKQRHFLCISFLLRTTFFFCCILQNYFCMLYIVTIFCEGFVPVLSQ